MPTNPWKQAMITAGANPKDVKVMSNVQQPVSGNKCPYCMVAMETVSLITPKRKAHYCTKCRAVFPLKID